MINGIIDIIKKIYFYLVDHFFVFTYIYNNPVIFYIILILILLLHIISTYKILKKLDKKWYMYLIPFYGLYLFFKTLNISYWYIIDIGLSVIFTYIIDLLIRDLSNYMLILSIIPITLLLIVYIKVNISIAKKLNYSKKYGIWLCFFTFPLLEIIAFSKKTTIVINDILELAKPKKSSETMVIVDNSIICPKCKSKLCENAIYCTNCEEYVYKLYQQSINKTN